MSVIILLILASLVVALVFLAGFIWAVRSGQFEDTYTPSLRILASEDAGRKQAGARLSQPQQPQLPEPQENSVCVSDPKLAAADTAALRATTEASRNPSIH